MTNVHDRWYGRQVGCGRTNRIRESGALTRRHGEGTGGSGARCSLLRFPMVTWTQLSSWGLERELAAEASRRGPTSSQDGCCTGLRARRLIDRPAACSGFHAPMVVPGVLHSFVSAAPCALYLSLI